jgi:DNA-binding GntR family transcriptional regulator
VAASEGYRRPKTAQQAALDELRHWVLAGRLKPGDQLVQENLAAELGVSVVPIREALKTMQSEGLLRYEPHRGFFVVELSRDELIELCVIRSALESMAVDRGLPTLSAGDIKAMDALADRMETAASAGDVVQLIQLDREFHFTVFRAAGMPHLERIIALTWDQSDPYRAAFFGDPTNRIDNNSEHRRILAAVHERDVPALNALLDAHRLGPTTRLSGLVEATP